MLTYRIAKTAFAGDLSGEGSRIYGGRWNRKGSAIVYTSQSRALATLEFLVHLPISCLPRDLSLVEIFVPDGIAPEELRPHALPSDWDRYPAPDSLALFGETWISERRSAVLKVPSVLIKEEFNILINPSFIGSEGIRIVDMQPFALNERLKKQT